MAIQDFSLNRRWVLVGGLWVAAGLASCSKAAENEVETAAGRVSGLTEDVVSVFKGIPYGESTAGAGRFMPSKPKAAWTGVRETVAFGASAQQSGPPPPPLRPEGAPQPYPFPWQGGEPSEPIPDSEDCLFLNVWTPAKTGKRPVLFWMHGGGFSSGNGSSLMYDGTNIAKKQDVVVVTINHRLNVYGYADLSAYGEQYAESGNVGMLDCVVALRWVKDNIEAFGGDPDRVLIFGESGGGRKVSMLMGSPPAQSLFHRAVAQSGPGLLFDSEALAQEKGARLLSELEIAPADVAKIHDVSAFDLFLAGQRASRGYGQFRPVVGPASLPTDPFGPEPSPVSKNVPLITGTNRTEDSAFLGSSRAMDSLSREELKARVENIVPPGKAEETLALYARLYANSGWAETLYMISTDRGYFLDSTIQAERKAALGGAPAYLYVFARETPIFNGRYFAPHSQEIPFVFDTVDKMTGMVGPLTPEVQGLADQMSATWANFAKTGMPSAEGMPEWVPYNAETRPTMVFDEGGRTDLVNNSRGEQRKLMASFGTRQVAQAQLPTT